MLHNGATCDQHAKKIHMQIRLEASCKPQITNANCQQRTGKGRSLSDPSWNKPTIYLQDEVSVLYVEAP